MQAVISSSETLHDVQRSCIEKAFECKLFDFYALAERVAFAGRYDVAVFLGEGNGWRAQRIRSTGLWTG